MENFGLKCFVINQDTIHEAQVRGEDIWEKAQTESRMEFLALEQLISDGFNDLSKDGSEFAGCVCVIAVDEAHLLDTWGASWRKAFQQIGWVWAWFSDVVLIVLTATMWGRKHIASMCTFLGLH
jgi:superfamily II DNA helicase RecQ